MEFQQGHLPSIFRQFAAMFRRAMTCAKRDVCAALYAMLKDLVNICPDLRTSIYGTTTHITCHDGNHHDLNQDDLNHNRDITPFWKIKGWIHRSVSSDATEMILWLLNCIKILLIPFWSRATNAFFGMHARLWPAFQSSVWHSFEQYRTEHMMCWRCASHLKQPWPKWSYVTNSLSKTCVCFRQRCNNDHKIHDRPDTFSWRSLWHDSIRSCLADAPSGLGPQSWFSSHVHELY